MCEGAHVSICSQEEQERAGEAGVLYIQCRFLLADIFRYYEGNCFSSLENLQVYKGFLKLSGLFLPLC